MGRRSLRSIYRGKLLKEMDKDRPRMLYVVSYDFKGSTPAIRMKLSRHMQALSETSKELGLVFERRTWSCLLCDERTMPVIADMLRSLGCKPEIFPVALNLTVIERHLIEAMKKLEEGDIMRAKRHVKAALRQLHGEPLIIVKSASSR